MLKDIHNYLLDEGMPKFMQGILGMQGLFRGFIVKDWSENNTINKRYCWFNKIVIKYYTEYYFD